MSDAVALEPKPVTVEDILVETSKMFGWTVSALLGPSRRRDLVRARHIAMYVCRHRTGLSYPQIARTFGNRDHTTIMHAVGKIDELVVRDARAAAQVMELTARIRGKAMVDGY